MVWLQLAWTEQHLLELLTQLTPVKADLSEGDGSKWIELDRPRNVTITQDGGMLIESSARIQWNLAGVNLPLSLEKVIVAVMPSIVEQPDGGQTLDFSVSLQDVDLSGVPGVVNTGLISVVNLALGAMKGKIGWKFTDTLRFNPKLPGKISPEMYLGIAARWGKVKVVDGALTLLVGVEFNVTKPSATTQEVAVAVLNNVAAVVPEVTQSPTATALATGSPLPPPPPDPAPEPHPGSPVDPDAPDTRPPEVPVINLA